ncbi:bifunctional 4-hydroxy-2-oxoglutarate aldolase/2-dehydro-3-deoxy-phosphogluconate aldolase [Parenemella sanctibonifatiensis]|uniref:2-dehydro-3-deoxy-phosphogluconate aldolase n=1 Tax=Parenemella sanctibonifatiensis TaxID=2016505 RepID=A0A255E5F1_9ACTN|nr:bifunctional 4-hydroxy-2-oxoglutarate aldolase/2-dehydro-3-deoxy-phosphogluconate aldolase [Parenemella sanctibonifatiensis]OYN86520.1 keto-deoxy-phosphogluconate aldolase [Parenemella sanctibonifatiensis]
MSHQSSVTLADVAACGVIPVVVLKDAAHAQPLAEALLAGGITTAEVTFRTDAAVESIRAMSSVEGMLVGAGTVISAEQVDQAAEAGARYIVSPGLSAAVVRRSVEGELLALPGVANASNIMEALELGLSAVKFFPAEVNGGAKAIKALAAPFPGLEFVPTGGVGLNNLADYLALPQVPAVGGSWMVPGDLVAAGAWEQITALASDAVAAVSQARSN